MSRSRRKRPAGHNESQKWDRTHSSRKYRKWVKNKIRHEEYDEIHEQHKKFWSSWNWSPDYTGGYFGDYVWHGIHFLFGWYVEYYMRTYDLTREEAIEKINTEEREEYKKRMRK